MGAPEKRLDLPGTEISIKNCSKKKKERKKGDQELQCMLDRTHARTQSNSG